jgi:hypothetical protein
MYAVGDRVIVLQGPARGVAGELVLALTRPALWTIRLDRPPGVIACAESDFELEPTFPRGAPLACPACGDEWCLTLAASRGFPPVAPAFCPGCGAYAQTSVLPAEEEL